MPPAWPCSNIRARDVLLLPLRLAACTVLIGWPMLLGMVAARLVHPVAFLVVAVLGYLWILWRYIP